jgi:AcrR family transcriptional regulator
VSTCQEPSPDRTLPDSMAVGASRQGVRGRPRVEGLSDAILEATIELAAEKDLASLTLEDIARRARVGRATIYRRWTSKEALVHDAIERIVDDFWPHRGPQEDGDIRADLVEFARVSIEQVQSPLRFVWTAFFNIEQSELASDVINRARDRASRLVLRAVERGQVRPGTDPVLLLQLIFGVIWLLNSTNRPIDPSLAESIVDAALNSCLSD